MTSAISLSEVTKRFQRKGASAVHAVDRVSLEVADHEFVCVVGPSGCGKSTLLRILAGLTPVTEGRAAISDETVVSPRQDVGIVFQKPVLLPWFTVFDNIMLPIKIYGLSEEAASAAAKQLIELVGLVGFEKSYPHELSGGMQQRVALARALVHDPKMLLMDEPFGALDAMTRQVMNVELMRIWETRKKTVLLITHDIAEAVFLSDRVFVMSARPGRILETLKIDLPRPRRLQVMTDPRFADYVQHIQKLLGLDESAAALGH